jgi:hypothetical protein
VHLLNPLLVPALLPALSENGLFTYDGKSVRASNATFVLTAKSKVKDPIDSEDEDAYKSRKKSIK